MIKLLKKYEVLTTPFEAVKTWAINNTDNENLLLYESTGSDDGLPYALEFIDFGSGFPVTSSTCDIALEQQDSDRATLELGLNVVGIFYPEFDPQNLDGTYKRSIYHQVKTMFYNMYYDPTKIWGIENIDFPLSKTKRRLSDEIRLLNIPRDVFGDKIVPKTVIITDNTTDNEYAITDDGYGNLLAGNNLFSNQQEIRHHDNEFVFGYSHFCDAYNTLAISTIPHLSLIYNPCIPPSIYLQWNIGGETVSDFVLQKSTDGINFNISFSFGPNTLNYYDTDITFSNSYWYKIYAENYINTSSFSNTVNVFAYSSSWTWDTDPDFWNVTCNPSYWDS